MTPERFMAQKLENIDPRPEKRYEFVYFMEDGTVNKSYGMTPHSIMLAKSYLAMVSVAKDGNSAPYVEIIKSQYGAASVIMTADVPSPAPQSSFLEEKPREDGMFHTRMRFVGDGPDPCQGGDYCDEICNGGIGCGKVVSNG